MNTDDYDFFNLAGFDYFTSQIPYEYYFPGNRVLIEFSELSTSDLNEFMLENFLQPIQFEKDKVLLEFKEPIKHFKKKEAVK